MAAIKIVGLESTIFELPNNTPLTELDSILNFGCRNAVCGACAIEVINGGDNLSAMQDNEFHFLNNLGLNTSSYRLACQCKVMGNITIKQS